MKAKVHRRAPMHGCSMEKEMHPMLHSAVNAETVGQGGFGMLITVRLSVIGLLDDEEMLELPAYASKPATFDK